MEIVLSLLGIIALGVVAFAATWEKFTIPKLIGGGLALALLIEQANKWIAKTNLSRPQPELLEPVLLGLAGVAVVLGLVLFFWDKIWEKIIPSA